MTDSNLPCLTCPSGRVSTVQGQKVIVCSDGGPDACSRLKNVKDTSVKEGSRFAPEVGEITSQG